MSQQPIFKVSGKKLTLPKSEGEWTLTQRPGGWILAERKNAKGQIERQRMMVSEVRGKLSASLGGRLWQGELVTPTRSSGGAVAASDSDLIAQFPGKVRKLMVKEGDSVSEGTPLVLVEAMKMEFSIKAPYNGKVTKVLVKEGQQLSPGDRFVEMEQAKDL